MKPKTAMPQMSDVQNIPLTNRITKEQFPIYMERNVKVHERLFDTALIKPFFNGAFTGGEIGQKAIKINNVPGTKSIVPDYWVVLPGGKHMMILQIQDHRKHFTTAGLEKDKKSNYIIAKETGRKVATLFISLWNCFGLKSPGRFGRVQWDKVDDLFSYIIERILYLNDNYQNIQYDDGNVHLEHIGYYKHGDYYPQKSYSINHFLGLERNILDRSKIARERLSYQQLTLSEYNIFKYSAPSFRNGNSVNVDDITFNEKKKKNMKKRNFNECNNDCIRINRRRRSIRLKNKKKAYKSAPKPILNLIDSSNNDDMIFEQTNKKISLKNRTESLKNRTESSPPTNSNNYGSVSNVNNRKRKRKTNNEDLEYDHDKSSTKRRRLNKDKKPPKKRIVMDEKRRKIDMMNDEFQRMKIHAEQNKLVKQIEMDEDVANMLLDDDAIKEWKRKQVLEEQLRADEEYARSLLMKEYNGVDNYNKEMKKGVLSEIVDICNKSHRIREKATKERKLYHGSSGSCSGSGSDSGHDAPLSTRDNNKLNNKLNKKNKKPIYPRSPKGCFKKYEHVPQKKWNHFKILVPPKGKKPDNFRPYKCNVSSKDKKTICPQAYGSKPAVNRHWMNDHKYDFCGGCEVRHFDPPIEDVE